MAPDSTQIFWKKNRATVNLSPQSGRARDAMYKIAPSTRNRALLVIALLALACLGLYRAFSDPTTDDVYLFVVDMRADQSRPLDLSEVFAAQDGKPRIARVIVRTINASQLIDSHAAFLQAVAERVRAGDNPRLPLDQIAERDKLNVRTLRQKLPSSDLFFIALDPPYSHTQKALRSTLDQQDQLKGKDRLVLLERIVPILQLAPYVWPDGCEQMKDDFEYMKSNFFGVGLFLDETAIGLLTACRPLG